MCPGIVVDNARPAVAWVTSLPKGWRVTAPERLILMCLACDAFDWESAPGYDLVAEWTGMQRSSCAEILTRLAEAAPGRPALIEKVSVRGRRRTIFRLRGEELGRPEPSGDAGRFSGQAATSEPSGPAGRLKEGGQGLNRPATQDGWGSEPSGHTGRLGGDPNRPAGQDGSGLDAARTVGEPSANRPAPPDTPLALNPKNKTQSQNPAAAEAAAADAVQELPLDIPRPAPRAASPVQDLVGRYVGIREAAGGTLTKSRRSAVGQHATRLLKQGLTTEKLIPAFELAARKNDLQFDRYLADPKGSSEGTRTGGRPKVASGNSEHWNRPDSGFFGTATKGQTA